MDFTTIFALKYKNENRKNFTFHSKDKILIENKRISDKVKATC